MTSTKTWVKYEEKENNVGVFKIQPLEKGMALTLGNSLRRILLSSLSGSAPIGMKIKGVSHEFSTIPNIKDDVLEIICNVKSLIVKNDNKDDSVIKLSTKGKKIITAKDLKCESGVEIINSDQYLFEMLSDSEIDLEIYISNGVGYMGVADLRSQIAENDIEYLTLDASFSPIVKVNYEVSNVRVGKSLDKEILIMTVQTNGTVNSEDCIKSSVEILSNQLLIFNSINDAPEFENEEDIKADEKLKSILNMSIDDLELSARSSNCLRRAGIENISELLQRDMSELFQIKNFGKKSADEINTKLNQYDLALKEL